MGAFLLVAEISSGVNLHEPILTPLVEREDGPRHVKQHVRYANLVWEFNVHERSMWVGSIQEFEALREEAHRKMRLVALRISEECGRAEPLREERFLRELPVADAFRCRELRRGVRDAYASRKAEPEAAILTLEGAVGELETLGDGFATVETYNLLGHLYANANRTAEERAAWNAVVAHAERFDMTHRLLSTLATLGAGFRREGKIDSMFACYDRVRAIADSARNPYHASRVRRFEGNYFKSIGRLALAEDLYHEAWDVCAHWDCDYRDTVVMTRLMELNASLGAWRRVAENLRVLKETLRQDTGNEVGDVHGDAVYLFGVGNVAAAVEVCRTLDEQSRDDPVLRAAVLSTWCRGLLEAEQPEPALAIAREGLSWSSRFFTDDLIHHLVRDFWLLRADAEARLAMLDPCFESLAEFDALAEPSHLTLPELVTRMSVEIEAHLENGDRERAEEILHRAIDELAGRMGELEPSEHVYLSVEQLARLEGILHALTGEDPARTYELEMAWRRFSYLAGGGAGEWTRRNRDDARDRLHALVSEGRGAIPAPRPLGGRPVETDEGVADHLVFRVGAERVVRWWAANGRVIQDTLSAPVPELRALVEEALRSILAPPGAADREEPLERLGEALIPHALAERGSAGLLLLSPEAFLAALPFAALDLASGPGYTPLLADRDVAYLRFRGGARDRSQAGGRALVLVDPDLPPAIRRRYPALANLPGAAEEGALVARSVAGAEVLQGPLATKAAVTSRWEDAPVIYAAAHVIRDPETRLRSFLPLAAPSGRKVPRDEVYLDLIDVRAADLGRCDLVVLSACSSGRPYVTLEGAAASLGDAFLDAGAAAVIESFWDVRDEDARDVMTSFVKHWRGGPGGEIAALCRAQREARSGGASVTVWANYAIELGGVPGPRTP